MKRSFDWFLYEAVLNRKAAYCDLSSNSTSVASNAAITIVIDDSSDSSDYSSDCGSDCSVNKVFQNLLPLEIWCHIFEFVISNCCCCVSAKICAHELSLVAKEFFQKIDVFEMYAGVKLEFKQTYYEQTFAQFRALNKKVLNLSDNYNINNHILRHMHNVRTVRLHNNDHVKGYVFANMRAVEEFEIVDNLRIITRDLSNMKLLKRVRYAGFISFDPSALLPSIKVRRLKL
jgi:hypothetical protein